MGLRDAGRARPGGRRSPHPSPAPLGSPGAGDAPRPRCPAACLLRAPPARPRTHAGPPPAWAVSRCRLDGGHRRPPAPPGPGGGKSRRRPHPPLRCDPRQPLVEPAGPDLSSRGLERLKASGIAQDYCKVAVVSMLPLGDPQEKLLWLLFIELNLGQQEEVWCVPVALQALEPQARRVGLQIPSELRISQS
ncbi:uncharacterized protein LOC131579212 [Poecile atricapillus]|uniref:uncharacterized protein LOC131579212 n=1 Tax=Poecile atricapillus TaxID=48891 RepID=UPI002739B181|nr:uncharacterized protein LOC131579212 [Poecile atricapillus]